MLSINSIHNKKGLEILCKMKTLRGILSQQIWHSKKWKQNKFVIELTSVMEFMLIEMGDSVAMRK